jgi:PEP-CTERM motif.
MRKPLVPPVFSLFVLALFVAANLAFAQNLYFRPEAAGGNPVSGGIYTWNTTLENWYSAAFPGGTEQAWNNAAPPATAFLPAVTTGSQYTIQLTTDISANNISVAGTMPSTTTLKVTSVDPGSRQTLTFSPGSTITGNGSGNRILSFEDLNITGNINVSGIVQFGNVTFSNSVITAGSGSLLYLNGLTNANVVMGAGTLYLNAATVVSVARLSGTGNINRAAGGSGGTLTLDQSENTILTGRFQNSGFSFTKDGAGTFIMNGGGGHSIDRAISVSEGAFYTDGTLPAAGAFAFTVSSGATVGGTFTANRPLTLSSAGSTVSPGLPTLDLDDNVVHHAGTLVLAAGLTGAGGATFDFYMDEDDGEGGLLNSRIDITGGTVTLGGTKTVNLFGLEAGLLETGVKYTLFDASGAGSLAAGWDESWVIGTNTTGLTIDFFGFEGSELKVSFVPEPTTASILAAGLLVLGARRIRRKAAETR